MMRLSRNRTNLPLQGQHKGLRKVFAASFLFFFVKGLFWLAVGGLALTGIV